MTIFRPCIDLHAGSVKQIVGGTLSDTPDALKTNHVSTLPAGHFAQLYKDNGLTGAHVIMLGPGNEDAAREAVSTWKSGLQVGGGITEKNAAQWIEWGAQKIIITSYLFPNGRFSSERLQAVLAALGNDKDKLVIDLSCRRRGEKWYVAMNKWQTITDMELNQSMLALIGSLCVQSSRTAADSISLLEPHCSEFLIHAADNEGLQQGIDHELVQKLAQWCSIPVTYAGGGKTLQDLDTVKELSGGKVDLTIGSALDIFGGSAVKFEDCVAWNRIQS
ncbi:Enzyme that catalyzes the fourth step in the histidine pathway [Coniosporium tulheliwenetii]|uniref:Enzyme that catalyzes the fourth step in the histidine pathway n=1 Tax=Coniosporium tulheliwenetii TaxID=3383036 RepID=A0ACC2Z6J4_9PEZI|nr:Enzyme that catalyzes the fourth step in the histidine pathway [Cladosporium sp. JES 115]